MECPDEEEGSGDDMQESWMVVLGIALGLTASIGINVGNNLQALGLQQQAALGVEKKTNTFITGTTVFAVASIVNFVAFAFAPAAVLAPLESVQFVTNLLFARIVRKEHVTLRMVVGVTMIVSGTVLSICFGPNKVASFTIEELKRFWRMTAWLAYLAFIGALAAVCLVCPTCLLPPATVARSPHLDPAEPRQPLSHREDGSLPHLSHPHQRARAPSNHPPPPTLSPSTNHPPPTTHPLLPPHTLLPPHRLCTLSTSALPA